MIFMLRVHRIVEIRYRIRYMNSLEGRQRQRVVLLVSQKGRNVVRWHWRRRKRIMVDSRKKKIWQGHWMILMISKTSFKVHLKRISHYKKSSSSCSYFMDSKRWIQTFKNTKWKDGYRNSQNHACLWPLLRKDTLKLIFKQLKFT